ncbi:MAG TPA: amidohydrolase, partial [Firmicutes bacterium]|nr:amidohydrolase [Bacillota bacterium]
MTEAELTPLKAAVCNQIAGARNEIVALAEDIFAHPELGFKETRTADRVAGKLAELGLEVERGLALTGVRALAPGREHKARVAILGELDAVVSPQHPQADPHTGAAHACGHHGQLAAMLGAAIGLVRSGIIKELGGDVVLMAVPAEEFVELAYRRRLMEQGKIEFFGGKQELIKAGAFDDLDAVLMVHAEAQTPERKAFVGGTCNGFIGKIVTYLGKAA